MSWRSPDFCANSEKLLDNLFSLLKHHFPGVGKQAIDLDGTPSLANQKEGLAQF
jgi:hypothetical protein